MGGNSAALYINPKTTQQCRLLAQSGQSRPHWPSSVGRHPCPLARSARVPDRQPFAPATLVRAARPEGNAREARLVKRRERLPSSGLPTLGPNHRSSRRGCKMPYEFADLLGKVAGAGEGKSNPRKAMFASLGGRGSPEASTASRFTAQRWGNRPAACGWLKILGAARVLPNFGSDHLPLIAELSLKIVNNWCRAASTTFLHGAAPIALFARRGMAAEPTVFQSVALRASSNGKSRCENTISRVRRRKRPNENRPRRVLPRQSRPRLNP